MSAALAVVPSLPVATLPRPEAPRGVCPVSAANAIAKRRRSVADVARVVGCTVGFAPMGSGRSTYDVARKHITVNVTLRRRDRDRAAAEALGAILLEQFRPMIHETPGSWVLAFGAAVAAMVTP